MSLAALSGFADGFAGAYSNRMDREERKLDRERQDALLAKYGEMGATPSMLYQGPEMGPGGMGASPGASMTAPEGNGVSSFLNLIDKTEGGGNYSTLYGHSQNGGRFDGVDVSNMTLAQLYEFSDPSGPYGQWVAANNNGTVATPMGRFQIVGSTLRNAADEMGLSPDTPFNANTQNAVAAHLARRRLSGARSPSAKRAALRAEWHGFRSVSDEALDQAIAQFEAAGGVLSPRPLGAAGPK